MSRLLKTSLHALIGMSALSAPLFAADAPVPIPASSAAPISRPYGIVGETEYPPPAPLAPLSTPTISPAPAVSPYTSAPSTVSSYYGAQESFGAPYSGAGAIYGTPGGYEARIGSPYHYYDPRGGQFVVTGDPYYDHFGPGFHRHSLHGHYRFPYYNYRAPWYYPGRAVYNRDTNFAW